ncbi:MAG TPA: ferredoxin reductase [Plantibacter sp.]|uniref:ferredoxin reductase n=1 Tax=unclassified Plantibacter TaxID=2624265 RepID=UPI002C6B053C|nr:ferredoxin reductase [Plantibacter sp.]
MKRPGHVDVWRAATVVEATRLTATGRSLMLDVPGWGGNLAGQHADVRLTAPDGYQAVRSYSIASADDGDRLEIAVDRLPDGEVSPFLVDAIEVGDQVEIRGPLGGWFVWRPEEIEPVLLIGGGSGVVPLMAMVRAHEAAGSPAPFHLVYSVRSPDDAFFAEELAGATGVDVTWIYTRRAPSDWPRPAGRLAATDLQALESSGGQTPSVFVCGPTGFVEAVADTLVAIGHDPARIKTERFGGA